MKTPTPQRWVDQPAGNQAGNLFRAARNLPVPAPPPAFVAAAGATAVTMTSSGALKTLGVGLGVGGIIALGVALALTVFTPAEPPVHSPVAATRSVAPESMASPVLQPTAFPPAVEAPRAPRPAPPIVTKQRTHTPAMMVPHTPEPALAISPVASEPAADDTFQPVPAPAPTAVDNSLRREAELMAQAVRALKQERTPERSLELLERYQAEYPRGLLLNEARWVRAEALRALGRSAEAMGALEGATAPGGRAGRELLLMRAELESENGRCGDAEGDFTAALLGANDDGIVPRGLLGRARCRLSLGQEGQANQDIDELLARFPQSPAAESARALKVAR